MYESYYGLSGKAFRLNPDPAFYFGSQGHSSAFSYLKYGVFQCEGFTVITGEIGAGKTTLVRALIKALDPSEVVCAQIVSTQLEADDLLRTTALAFGLNVTGLDKAQLLGTLEAFLMQLATEGRRALLVVDEAQNLSERALEELRMLSNFQIDDAGLLQSFLVGQPELRQLLRQPRLEQLRQRVIASYHLGPMTQAETRGYIEHRLGCVGYKGDPKFDPAAFKEFFQATGGIPRRINMLANRVLLAAYLAERHRITALDVRRAAKEMGDELGADVSLQPDSAQGGRAMDRVSEHAGHSEPARALALSSVNARLDKLERSMQEILEHLKGHQAVASPRGMGVGVGKSPIRTGKPARQVPS